jgi:hypothetical protein
MGVSSAIVIYQGLFCKGGYLFQNFLWIELAVMHEIMGTHAGANVQLVSFPRRGVLSMYSS